jgi:hypothetical protein
MIAIDTFTTGRKPIATIQPRNYRTTEPKTDNSVKSTTPPSGTTETHNFSDATMQNPHHKLEQLPGKHPHAPDPTIPEKGIISLLPP